MKPKIIIIAALALLLVALAITGHVRVAKWQSAYYLAVAGKSQVVQSAQADAAAMKARHDAALAAEAARVSAAQQATAAAQATAAQIRVRSAAELAAARQGAATIEADRDLLAGEVEARGLRITALDTVISRQVEQITALNGEVGTLTAALDEQRALTAQVTGQLQQAVARALRANTSRWGIGPVVAYGWGDDGRRHLAAGIGITYALIRPRL